jgi:hypothetical protein
MTRAASAPAPHGHARRRRDYALAALAPAMLLAVGWRLDARAVLSAYLAAWWFVTGALLGGLAHVWLHQLTGGEWGESIRGPLLRAARWLPLACLLFLPVLAGMQWLYPWSGAHGVQPDTGAGAFRRWWLSPLPFIARSVAYLLLWSALAWAETRAPRRSQGRAAACLLLYGFSAGLAAVDWIASLQPEWYSSVFGWLACAGQMLTGLALAVLLIDRKAQRARLPDLGNLLLMYVMTWAYLAYVQFLIIWAADLPREISWYLRRGAPGWQAVAWTLLAFHGALPLMILLSRRAKRAPALLGVLAAGLLAAHMLDCWWLVLPSVSGLTVHALWLAPVTAAGFCLAGWMVWDRPHATVEGSHA